MNEPTLGANAPAATRESILGDGLVHEMPYANVLVPEWGGALRVYALSSDEMDEFHKETLRRAITEKKAKKDPARFKAIPRRVRVRLAIATVRDLNGNTILLPGDEEAIGKKPPASLERIWNAAAKLCGLDPEEDDDPGN